MQDCLLFWGLWNVKKSWSSLPQLIFQNGWPGTQADFSRKRRIPLKIEWHASSFPVPSLVLWHMDRPSPVCYNPPKCPQFSLSHVLSRNIQCSKTAKMEHKKRKKKKNRTSLKYLWVPIMFVVKGGNMAIVLFAKVSRTDSFLFPARRAFFWLSPYGLHYNPPPLPKKNCPNLNFSEWTFWGGNMARRGNNGHSSDFGRLEGKNHPNWFFWDVKHFPGYHLMASL